MMAWIFTPQHMFTVLPTMPGVLSTRPTDSGVGVILDVVL